MKKVLQAVCILLAAVLFAQCGSTTIVVPVMRPAEVNLGKIKKVAVGKVTGVAAADVEDDLINQLIQSSSFDVLDRSNLDQILREYRLSMSELIDERTALELGKLLGAAALIFGRVTDYKYDERIVQGEPYKDKDGKTHIRSTREGKARVSINFRITDLTTGKFIFSRELGYTADAQTYIVDGRPPRIDDDELLKNARRRVIQQFINRISPHWENINVRLLTDSEIPELETGISYAKIREWDRSIELFSNATEKYKTHKSLHKAYYNLGVAYEYNAQFAEAMSALKRAFELEADNDYLREIESCRRREREYNALQEQMRNE